MIIYKRRDIYIKNNKEIENLQSSKNKVSLQEMLDARETRVFRQDKLISKGKSLIAFTMNIAGEYKNSPLIEKAFEEGVFKIKQLLQWNNIEVEKFEKHIEKTGCEGYFLASYDAYKVKKILMQIEDSFALGRLFDIDVIKDNSEKISREDVGIAPRSCIVCGKQGAGCARSRAHSIEQITQCSIDIICDFFNNDFADKVAQNAVKALLYEVSVTPKPGLVDRENNGSHNDMDFFTFINSSCSLFDYFKKCVLKGIDMHSDTPSKLFEKIRYIGRLAEYKMLKATNGVNTHKGAIFSLGIICAAVGYCLANGDKNDADKIFAVSAQMAKGAFADFDGIKEPTTFGESLYLNKKFTGVRGQAAQGFPAVKDIAYPKLVQFINNGDDVNTASLKVLLLLMQTVDDTNIIKRSDIKTLENIKLKISCLFSQKEFDIKKELQKLDKEFIELNISPGGSADLLAIALMMYFTVNSDNI